MTLSDLRGRLSALPFFERVRDEVDGLASGDSLRLRGTVGSLPGFVLADVLDSTGGPLVALLAESESADYLRSDLEQVLGGVERVLFLPPTGQDPYDPEQLNDSLPLVQRADALGRLRDGFDGILVTSVEAISELVPLPETVSDETLTVRVGDTAPPEDLMDRLSGQGFQPVEFVSEPGELALRGGILDVYPFAGGYPVRLEFFGDEVDQIREFDPQSQRSITRLESTRLVPNLDADRYTEAGHVTPLDYLAAETPLALFDSQRLVEKAQELYNAATAAYAERVGTLEDGEDRPAPPDAQYLTGEALSTLVASRPALLFGTFSDAGDREVELQATPQPSYNGDLGRLREDIEGRGGTDYVVLCDSASQKNRLWELLGGDLESGKPPKADLLVESLHEGFEVPAAKLAVYTDHQLFNRYHRPTSRKKAKARGGLSLREVKALRPGDFVVHVDYGIGKFAGMQTITVREQKQEAVRLIFKGGDELFVNVAALHKLHKYTGKEGHQPRLTKLGTGAWDRLKARTKKRGQGHRPRPHQDLREAPRLTGVRVQGRHDLAARARSSLRVRRDARPSGRQSTRSRRTCSSRSRWTASSAATSGSGRRRSPYAPRSRRSRRGSRWPSWSRRRSWRGSTPRRSPSGWVGSPSASPSSAGSSRQPSRRRSWRS